MNEKALESFINTCDEMLVPTQEGFIQKHKEKKIGKRVRNVLGIYSDSFLVNTYSNGGFDLSKYFSKRLGKTIKPNYQIAIDSSYIKYLTACKSIIEQQIAKIYDIVENFVKENNTNDYSNLLNKCENVKEMIMTLEKKYHDLFVKIDGVQKIGKLTLEDIPTKSTEEVILSATEFTNLLNFSENTQDKLHFITTSLNSKGIMNITAMVGNSYYALSKKLTADEIRNIAIILNESTKPTSINLTLGEISNMTSIILKETGTLMKNLSGNIVIIDGGKRIPV